MDTDSSITLTLTVPWSDVKKVYDQIIDLALTEIEIEGFRKGMAPRELALKKIDTGKVYGEVVNQILPKAYADEVKKQNLTPIVSPKVQIVTAEENKDWVFKAMTAQKPDVDLGDYKAQIKTGKIWTPGSAKATPDEQGDAESKSKRINDIITKLLEVAKLNIPHMLIDDEADRLLAMLIDDIRAAGLTFEQYLQSKGLNADQIKAQYHSQAETTLKLEFILGEIAQTENISVTQEEIDAVIAKEKDEKSKDNLKKQSYLLASVLRREKTLTYLANL
ncbi:hypothetical protein A2872_01135 [Candidatus Gottesmanbacteria bacterium RIFCSPHIGHO2_01_FULL_42_12]|uniref:Trigger factor n=1 Tax=Candidatus Gottesmanbacteria bacterium RIFCSPHIGHO2_01_FULL_42_12 TaxID=1798377 RepID=A0A1F5Z1N3_9BACT|nr:MAG: hypothetical protein A2872_01135 [Candidatus Gottesmanbacteria bacterium RIFCSPHIGHO2_01_FULL_42_12]